MGADDMRRKRPEESRVRLVSSAREGESGESVEGEDWRDYDGNFYAGA